MAAARPKYVTWDRWDAEHRALREHEDDEHRALAARIDDTEARCATLEQARARRADRLWLLAMAFLTGLALPLVLLALTTWFQPHG